MQMPFGKHKGTDVQDIPESYLEWLLENVRLRSSLKAAVCGVLGINPDDVDDPPESDQWKQRARGGRQQDSQQRIMKLIEVVESWQRRMARKFHPDRGGTTEMMQAINDATDDLVKSIRESM